MNENQPIRGQESSYKLYKNNYLIFSKCCRSNSNEQQQTSASKHHHTYPILSRSVQSILRALIYEINIKCRGKGTGFHTQGYRVREKQTKYGFIGWKTTFWFKFIGALCKHVILNLWEPFPYWPWVTDLMKKYGPLSESLQFKKKNGVIGWQQFWK